MALAKGADLVYLQLLIIIFIEIFESLKKYVRLIRRIIIIKCLKNEIN